MSMNEDRAAVENRIKTLHGEMSQYLKASRARASRTAWLMTLLVLIVAGYLSFLYSKLELVNADTVSQIAYAQAVDFLKDAPPQVSKALKDKAPAVFDMAELKLMQTPTMVSDYIKQAAIEKTQMVLTQSEPRINAVLTDSVAHAKQALVQAGFDGKDPKQFDAMVTKLSADMREQMTGELNAILSQYAAQGDVMLKYIDEIAVGRNLDERQQHLRNVIVSFLAVAEKNKVGQ